MRLQISIGDDVITSSGKIAEWLFEFFNRNIWDIVDEEYDEDDFETLDVTKCPLSNLMQLKEVIRITNTRSVESQNVIGFAFIFHIDEVESGLVSITGMMDGYYIRYIKNYNEDSNSRLGKEN